MTVHISSVGAAILVVGIVLGYFVFKHTRSTAGSASKGDIVGAIICATAVISVLFIAFGGGAPEDFKSSETVGTL
ncbi:hypothetical protein ABCR94_20365 [Streptomyces sp. 21So2-11]|uniref:hypothetical protein n=1 Tax=Streptomyces sp. 21So2-11 TaxID=3144408 RepID=UPI00321B52C3